MKTYPEKISINQLAELTGRDRRTITQRLSEVEPEGEGRSARYDIRVALRAIFEFDEDEVKDLDFTKFQPRLEKAKLDFRKREEVELDIAVKKRDLMPRDELRQSLGSLFGSIRARILALPIKLAQQIKPTMNAKEIEEISRGFVREALTELSELKELKVNGHNTRSN